MVLFSVVAAPYQKTIRATYRVPAPGGSWDTSDNGVYTIRMLLNQVQDAAGNAIAAGGLGSFRVGVT